MHLRLIATLTLLLTLITGCGVSVNQPISNLTVKGPAGSAFGGEQPIVGAQVTLWAAGTSGYGTGATQLAQAVAVTSATGAYSFGTITCTNPATPTYLLATGGDAGAGNNVHIVLAAASGACGNLANATVNISEVTTAATAYAMAQFFTTTLTQDYTKDMFGGSGHGSGYLYDNPGLVNADLYTVPNLVDLAAPATSAAHTTYTLSGLTTTYESAKLYTVANILAACVDSNGATLGGIGAPTPCASLFRDTTDGNGQPYDTLQAAVQIALFPWMNVGDLYTLPPPASPFVGLSAQPNDWSLGISYTSAAYQLGLFSTSTFSSSSNIDIDDQNNIWFPTNLASSPGIAELITSAGVSPIFSPTYLTGIVTHPQYLAIANPERIYVTDTAGNEIPYTSTSSPSATADGSVLVGTAYNQYVGPIVASPDTTQRGDDINFTYGLGANQPNRFFASQNQAGNNFTVHADLAAPPVSMAAIGSPLDQVIASESGSASCGLNRSSGSDFTGGGSPCLAGGVAQTTYTSATGGPDFIQAISSSNQLCDIQPTQSSGACFASPVPLDFPESVAVDGLGNIWIANYANASVSTLGYAYSAGTSADYFQTSTVPYLHGSANGGTMTNPIGIAIDNSGNVWVSNGCIAGTNCTLGAFTLSELIGAAAPTLTPLVNGIDSNRTGTRPGGEGSAASSTVEPGGPTSPHP